MISGARVAVLGGGGFLGSHLCERLLSDGAQRVVCVDDFSTGDERNIAAIRTDRRFELVRGDIIEGISLSGRLEYVFNLASPASPIDYGERPIQTLRTGAIGTENGLKLAERTGAVFVQASTSEIYGDPLVHPQSEDYAGNVDPTGPRAVYDEAKRYGEAIVSAYRRHKGVKTRIARIFNTYGPRMRLDDGRVVPAFIGQALRGEPLTLFGGGNQTRSFCYVSDLIDGLVRLAISSRSDPVNLGNPEEITVRRFAEVVKAAVGGGGPLVERPLPTGDPRQRRPDIRRAKEWLGWQPVVGLEEGLQKTIAYFREVAAAG